MFLGMRSLKPRLFGDLSKRAFIKHRNACEMCGGQSCGTLSSSFIFWLCQSRGIPAPFALTSIIASITMPSEYRSLVLSSVFGVNPYHSFDRTPPVNVATASPPLTTLNPKQYMYIYIYIYMYAFPFSIFFSIIQKPTYKSPCTSLQKIISLPPATSVVYPPNPDHIIPPQSKLLVSPLIAPTRFIYNPPFKGFRLWLT